MTAICLDQKKPARISDPHGPWWLTVRVPLGRNRHLYIGASTAERLGDIAAGADTHEGDPAKDAGRLIADLAAARERLDQQTAEIERLSGWRRLWRDRYRNLWQISEQYRSEFAAAQARAEQAEAKVRAAELLHVWTNEDGKRFVFVEDLGVALKIPGFAPGGDAARPLPEPEQR